jgi:hypothetical protein
MCCVVGMCCVRCAGETAYGLGRRSSVVRHWSGGKEILLRLILNIEPDAIR